MLPKYAFVPNATTYTYCLVVASNFVYGATSEWCLDLDVARYIWLGVSILIDLIITWIPLEIIRHTRLRTYERRILFAAFSANLLGTIVWYAKKTPQMTEN